MTLAWTTAAAPSPYRMQDPRPTNDASNGGAELLTQDGRSLPLVSAKLRVEAGGGLARIVLEQTFDNPYDDTLAVTYKMPLPVDGAVSGYAFRIGTRSVEGRVDRKETARARFEEAIASGKTAALLEQNRADIFTQEVGNIPPRCAVVAVITIDQRLAWTPEGQWELRFPTVIGPRYVGAHVTEEDRLASHVELANGSVRGRVHLEMRISDAITDDGRVESPSHALQARAGGTIELLDLAGARLDRDVVVRWPVATRDVGLALQVARPAAGVANGRHAYALLSIVPPAPDAGYRALPRDLIVLLDTSGSMAGSPLEQGKRVVAALIDSLSEQDRLEVVEFSMRPNRYTRAPVPGTKRERDKAIQWVMARRANGGTEMHSAIVDALRGLRPGAQRQVVLVTDGYVGGEEQIVRLLHESLPQSCRLHVVGVGSATNRALAASLARAGRGAEVLVGLDEDAERSAKSLVDKTRAPVLTDLTISGDALVEHCPEHVPDVFAGAPVLAALQVRATGGEIVVRGTLARGVWEQRVRVAAANAGDGNQAIVKLYGRERVADLEMRWTIGNEVQAIDREIESIGLVFQIATRRTSWVAIDDDRNVDPRLGSRHEEIPQELPYGTTMASFGGPPPAQSLGAPVRAMAMASMGSRPAAGLLRPAARMPSAPEDDEDMTMAMRSGSLDAPKPRSISLARPRAPEKPGDESASRPDSSSDEPATLRPPPPASAAMPAARPMALPPPPPAPQSRRSPQPSAPQQLQPPAYHQAPQITVKEEGEPLGGATRTTPSRQESSGFGAPKRTSMWLIALIAALVAFVVTLAAILAWVLAAR